MAGGTAGGACAGTPRPGQPEAAAGGRGIISDVLNSPFVRDAAVLLALALALGFMVLALRSQHRVREALRELAAGFGWEDLRKPFFAVTLLVTGTWNGRAVALRYRPPSKNSPPYVSAEITLSLPGRFELRGRPQYPAFWNTPIVLLGPPAVDLFDPADAAEFRAWADDRSVLDRLFALPGIRPLLSENLGAGGASLRLKNGVLRARRSTRIFPSFRFGADPDQICAIAREEWALLAAASALA